MYWSNWGVINSMRTKCSAEPAPQAATICAHHPDELTCSCTGTVYFGKRFKTGNPGSGAVTTFAELKAGDHETKSVTGSILCTSAQFGPDPALGFYKHCYCEVVSKCEGVTCSAKDQCHEAGVCDPQTGTCSDPFATSGKTCDDGSATTRDDKCNSSGTCSGAEADTTRRRRWWPHRRRTPEALAEMDKKGKKDDKKDKKDDKKDKKAPGANDEAEDEAEDDDDDDKAPGANDEAEDEAEDDDDDDKALAEMDKKGKKDDQKDKKDDKKDKKE